MTTAPMALAKKSDNGASVKKTALPSGVKIKRIKRGKGANPSASDTVLLNYEIVSEDGDSLIKARWQTLPLNDTLGGLSLAIAHMQKGGRYEVSLSSEHGFGIYSPTPSIPPNSPVKLKVELLDFAAAPDAGGLADTAKLPVVSALQPEVLQYTANQPGVITQESGLKYKILKAGEGARPGATDTTLLGYEGRLLNGTIFDANEQTSLPVSGVVPGFAEALQLMQKGGRYRIWIPPALGYGDRATGSIPPGSWLVFDVTLQDFISSADLQKLREEAR